MFCSANVPGIPYKISLAYVAPPCSKKMKIFESHSNLTKMHADFLKVSFSGNKKAPAGASARSTEVLRMRRPRGLNMSENQ